MSPLDWPFVLTMVLLGVVVLLLATSNWRALRAVLRPGGALGAGPARSRARYAWLLSITAFFSGPVAPILGILVGLFGLWARRTVKRSTLQDPLDRAAADAAILNGFTIAMVGAWIMFAVWLADALR